MMKNEGKNFRVFLFLAFGLLIGQLVISWQLNSFTRWQVQVLKVYDGDTILVMYQKKEYRVRLLYVDAPEIDQTGFLENQTATKVYQVGELSKKYLEKLLERTITIKVRGTDRYGRLLGVLYVGNRNLNYEMVLGGMVYLYNGAGFRTEHNKEMFFYALDYAKKNKKGFWKYEKIQNPSGWRRYKKKIKSRL